MRSFALHSGSGKRLCKAWLLNISNFSALLGHLVNMLIVSLCKLDGSESYPVMSDVVMKGINLLIEPIDNCTEDATLNYFDKYLLSCGFSLKLN